MDIKKLYKLDYDFVNDSLYVVLEKGVYHKSLEKDGFLLDLDENNNILGFEILYFAQNSGFDKNKLMKILDGKVHLNVKEGNLSIRMSLTVEYRNKKSENAYFLNSYLNDTVNNVSLDLAI